MKAFFCVGCSYQPCWLIFDNAVKDPTACPYGGEAEWKRIDIVDALKNIKEMI